MKPSPGREPRSRPAAAPSKRAVAAGVFVVFPLALLAGCAKPPAPRAQRVPVTVATAVRRDIPFAITAQGTVEPVQTAAVGSQVGGTVVRVNFREGQEVRAGQVLFELDPRPFRTALEQTEATLAKDRAQATDARLEAERAKTLFEQNVLSKSDWDAKRTASESWAATVRADQASSDAARLNLRYSAIRAPIAGTTGRWLVHVGDLVKAATSDPLVTINQLRPVRVSFSVPENAAPLVQKYRAANPQVIVTSSSADTADIVGRLAFVDNSVDPANGTLLLKGEFPNTDRRLVPGEFVQLRLQLYVQPGATVVPAVAVATGQQGNYVYVMNADSTVVMKPVTVERTQDEMTIVRQGLTPGDIVITDGQFRLSPGAHVLVRREGAGPS